MDELRAAAWRASRFGLGGRLVSPESRELADAGDVLKQMTALLAEPLAQAGDLALVTDGLRDLLTNGSGAARQRAAFAATRSLTGVVADLRERTAQG